MQHIIQISKRELMTRELCDWLCGIHHWMFDKGIYLSSQQLARRVQMYGCTVLVDS